MSLCVVVCLTLCLSECVCEGKWVKVNAFVCDSLFLLSLSREFAKREREERGKGDKNTREISSTMMDGWYSPLSFCLLFAAK